MARYLVVAHETATNPVLSERLREIQAQDSGAEFTLLVPATPVRHLLFLHGSEHDADVVAGKLTVKAQKAFAKHAINLAGARVGAGDPLDAIDQEVTANPGYAGFVISTLPEENSRWLRLDLPAAVEKKYGLPVHHVNATAEWFEAAALP